MISLENVYKRYVTDHVPGDWVLEGVSVDIPPKACVGVVGGKGSGKSTLLRLIADVEAPTSGKIERTARVAMPLSYVRAFQPLLSGRQNAKFICRINGYVDDMEERLAHIENLSGLREKFGKPVSTYTPPMKSSLSFALSMALDFDVYISDCFNFSAEVAFKSDEAADAALRSLIERAGIIMVTQGGQWDTTLRRYCKSGIWLHEKKAEWFDDIEDAIEAYRASQPSAASKSGAGQVEKVVSEHMLPILARMRQLGNSFHILKPGLQGTPATVSEKESVGLIQAASQVQMRLLTREQILEHGYRVQEGAVPVLRRKTMAAEPQVVDLYDLETQCEKIGLAT